MIPPDDIVKIPAFHFNNNYPKIRSNNNKVRMPVVDVGFIIDKIIIGKFF